MKMSKKFKTAVQTGAGFAVGVAVFTLVARGAAMIVDGLLTSTKTTTTPPAVEGSSYRSGYRR